MKKKISLIVRIVFGLVILAALVYHIQSSEDLLKVLVHARVEFLALGFIAFIIHYFTVYLRWRYVLNGIGKMQITNSVILKSLFGGSAMGLITPGRLGELGKGVFFEKNLFWRISGLSIIDKGYAHVASILLGVTSLVVIGQEKIGIWSGSPYLLNILLALLLLVGFIAIFRPRLFALLLARFSHYLPQRMASLLAPLIENLNHLSRKNSITLALLSLLVNLSTFLEFYIILNAFVYVTPGEIFWAFEAAFLAVSFFPFSFSDIGIREGMRIFFLGLYGISAAAVLNASLLMFIINALIPAGLGLIAISRMKIFFGNGL